MPIVKQIPFRVYVKLVTFLCGFVLLLCWVKFSCKTSINWQLVKKRWQARGTSCFGWIFIVCLMGVTAMVITICDEVPDISGVPNFYLIVILFFLRLFYSVYRQEMQKKEIAVVREKKQKKIKTMERNRQERFLAARAARNLLWQHQARLEFVLT